MTSPRPSAKAPFARRAGAWLAWWVLLTSFWVILDDSIAADELLAGAGAAALAALLAELVTYLSLTDESFQVVFDESAADEVSWSDAAGRTRSAVLPRVTFARTGSGGQELSS